MCPPDFRGGGFSGRFARFRTFAHFADHNPPGGPRRRARTGSSPSGTAAPPPTSATVSTSRHPVNSFVRSANTCSPDTASGVGSGRPAAMAPAPVAAR